MPPTSTFDDVTDRAVGNSVLVCESDPKCATSTGNADRIDIVLVEFGPTIEYPGPRESMRWVQ